MPLLRYNILVLVWFKSQERQCMLNVLEHRSFNLKFVKSFLKSLIIFKYEFTFNMFFLHTGFWCDALFLNSVIWPALAHLHLLMLLFPLIIGLLLLLLFVLLIVRMTLAMVVQQSIVLYSWFVFIGLMIFIECHRINFRRYHYLVLFTLIRIQKFLNEIIWKECVLLCFNCSFWLSFLFFAIVSIASWCLQEGSIRYTSWSVPGKPGFQISQPKRVGLVWVLPGHYLKAKAFQLV